jgi:hypothetical protein
MARVLTTKLQYPISDAEFNGTESSSGDNGDGEFDGNSDGSGNDNDNGGEGDMAAVMMALMRKVVPHFSTVKSSDNPEDLCDPALGHNLKLGDMPWPNLQLPWAYWE